MTSPYEWHPDLSRRTFLKALAASGLPAMLTPFVRADAQGAALPNIVILYADDMGYGDLAVQNPDSKIPTPHLDRLAQEGVRFTDAHSSSGICTPSRFALLTGMYHWRKFHGIVNSFGGPVFGDELTLPAMLRQQGYSTACIGKWHLGWDWDAIRVGDRRSRTKIPGPDDFDWQRPLPGGPLSHGFNYYFGDDVPNFPPYAWIENDCLLTVPTEMYAPDPMPEEGNHEGRPGPMTPGWKLDEVMPRLTERAVSWIAAQKDSERPFFLYFPWTSPHTPIVPAPEFKGSTGAGPYGDFVHQSDWSAGQVLQALDTYGFRENTLVIFSSDNGPEHYAYERVRAHGHRSMGPLRGLKRDIYEGGHRVPMLMRRQGVISPGSVSDALISQVDFMATIATLTGYTLPGGAAVDSYDMSPLLRAEPPDSPIRKVHVHNTHPNHYALRQGDWVYLDVKSGAHSNVPEWYNEEYGYVANPHDTALYNLRDDISQRVNLIDRYPEHAAAMKEVLEQVMKNKDSN